MVDNEIFLLHVMVKIFSVSCLQQDYNLLHQNLWQQQRRHERGSWGWGHSPIGRQYPLPVRRSNGKNLTFFLFFIFKKIFAHRKIIVPCQCSPTEIFLVPSLGDRKICTIFVPIPAHAPITAHQRHFQFKICGTINRPLKSSHPVASYYVPSPVLNTETTSWCFVNFHLLTFRPISCFYQLFKLTNFEQCHNQQSLLLLLLGHLSPIC